MAQYIKKVAVTPVRGNGFIVDSFNTNDNKSLNAPSIAAVEQRADNNLLFMGNIGAITTGNQKAWEYTPAEGNTKYAGFAPVSGFMISGGGKGILKSPLITCYGDDIPSFCGINADTPFSVSFIFASTSVPSGQTPTPNTLGKIENVTFNTMGSASKVYNFDNKFKVSVARLFQGGYFWLNVECPNDDYGFHIMYIKLELGTTCTPINPISRDIGANSLIENLFKVYELTDDDHTIAAQSRYTGYIRADVVNGYTPIGILSARSQASIPTGACLQDFHISYHSSGYPRVEYSYFNQSQYNSTTITPKFRVLYIKGNFTVQTPS